MAKTSNDHTLKENEMDGDRWFLFSAGLILAIAGFAKGWSAIATTRILNEPDPIFGLQFRHMMLVVGAIELVIAYFCLFTAARSFSIAMVAWMATNFLGYRLGLWWMDWHRPCGCLGNLTDALHLSPQTADTMLKVILVYLLMGSYWLLFLQWRRRRHLAKVAIAAVETVAVSKD